MISDVCRAGVLAGGVFVWWRGCARWMTGRQDAEGGLRRLGVNWLKFWQTGSREILCRTMRLPAAAGYGLARRESSSGLFFLGEIHQAKVLIIG